MNCNAHNHPADCQCGFGGDTGGRPAVGFALPEGNFEYFGTLLFPQSTWKTSCPVCGEFVYFYQNAFGSKVWFDDLGWPWQKHGCFIDGDCSKVVFNQAAATPLDWRHEKASLIASSVCALRGWSFAVVYSPDKDPNFTPRWFASWSRIPRGRHTLLLQPNQRCILVPEVGTKPIEVFSEWSNANIYSRTRYRKRANIALHALKAFLKCRKAVKDLVDEYSKAHVCAQLYDGTDLTFSELAAITDIKEERVREIADGDTVILRVGSEGRVREATRVIIRELRQSGCQSEP